MDLKDKTILILGGSGLVGEAVARRVIPRRPKRIVLVALYEDETEEAVQLIGAEAGDVEIESTWGNIFLPADAARMSYRDALAKDKLRELIIVRKKNPSNTDDDSPEPPLPEDSHRGKINIVV